VVSAWSLAATLAIVNTIPPAQVVDFAASDGEDSKCTLSWTNPSDSDLDEVVVCRKLDTYPADHTDGTQVFRDISPTPEGHADYEDGGLANGTTYYYAVFSRNALGSWNDAVEVGMNADSGTPVQPGSIIVKGQLAYRREWLAESSPPGTPAAVTGFRVELYDREPAPKPDVYLERAVYTDAVGNFEFPAVENYDGPLQGGLDIYVRVIARNSACWVGPWPFDRSSANVYWFNSEVTGDANPPNGVLELGTLLVDDFDMCHALQVADTVRAVIDWYAASPVDHVLSGQPLLVTWPAAAATAWKHLSGFLELASYDWSDSARHTMFHEIAHAVWQDLGQEVPMLGTGWLVGHNQMDESDALQAVVEGWAEFFAAYAGHSGLCGLGGLENIEDNHWWMGADAVDEYTRTHTWTNPNHNSGEVVEGAVASILWDIADDTQLMLSLSCVGNTPSLPASDDDSLCLGATAIAQVVKGDQCSSIGDFISHWFAVDDGSPANYGHAEELREICQRHGVPFATVSPGANVSAAFEFPDLEENVHITFESVSTGGVAYVTRSASSGFLGLFASASYDVTTDCDFSGVLEVAIQYSDVGLTPEQERSLRIYHVTAPDTKIDITVSVDTVGNVVTGRTAGLSSFFVGLPPMVGDVNRDGAIDQVDVRLCLQMATCGVGGTVEERTAADIDRDGDVDMTDALVLAEYVLGLGSTLP
jgi:hypothetical protein